MPLITTSMRLDLSLPLHSNVKMCIFSVVVYLPNWVWKYWKRRLMVVQLKFVFVLLLSSILCRKNRHYTHQLSTNGTALGTRCFAMHSWELMTKVLLYFCRPFKSFSWCCTSMRIRYISLHKMETFFAYLMRISQIITILTLFLEFIYL